MPHGLAVLMLLTDGFGGVGGIAKFNRDFLQALDGSSLVERVQALPRLIPEPIEVSFSGGAVSRIRSVANNRSHESALMEPELISNLPDKNRVKRRSVRFAPTDEEKSRRRTSVTSRAASV